MAKQTKDTRNNDVLQQRVEWLENENKHLKQFNVFIEEHHINTLNKKVRDLYHRLRHSKLVYKRTVPTLQKKHHEVIKMNINLSNSFSKQMTEIDFYQNELSNYKNKIDIQLLDLGTKDLIIQDLKDVIIEQKSKLVAYNHFSNTQNDRIGKLISDMQVVEFANKRQSEIIKELQLENIEVNKLLKFRTQMINYVFLPICIVSMISSIITLIK